MRSRPLERFSRDFGLVGIENGMQLTQIGNRLTCSTDAELMAVSVDTWRSDFEFSLFKFVFQTPMRLRQTNDFPEISASLE